MLPTTKRCAARLGRSAAPSAPLLSSRRATPTAPTPARHASSSAPSSTTLSPLNLAKAAFQQARAKPLMAADGRTPIRLEDPLLVLGHELGSLRANVQQLLGSKHPGLDKIAKYYFQQEGKHVRPMIVLLMAQATNGLAPGYGQLAHEQATRPTYNDEIEPANVLNDHNPDLLSKAKEFITNPLSAIAGLASPDPSSSSAAAATAPLPSSVLLLPTQRRLAEIIEMIHVASLLHDDVIDVADTRRSSPSAPALFGNKLSILAGDFLLARASLACARLGSVEVVELIASVLANLVEGEVMQMKGNSPGRLGSTLTPEIMEHYITKSYMKTASLIAKSARATTILGGCGVKQGWAEGEQIKDAAYTYGKHLGIAFQLVDDMLDFTATAADLGKPGGGADLKLGLATAPALYAWEEFPELGALIERKFAEPGDVERAGELISRSSGAARTLELAREHSEKARQALLVFPESEARDALDKMARDTLTRRK